RSAFDVEGSRLELQKELAEESRRDLVKEISAEKQKLDQVEGKLAAVKGKKYAKGADAASDKCKELQSQLADMMAELDQPFDGGGGAAGVAAMNGRIDSSRASLDTVRAGMQTLDAMASDGSAAAGDSGNGTAYQALYNYMVSHNYGKSDMGTYMKDPQWQKLHAAAYPGWQPDYPALIADGSIPGSFSDMVGYRGLSGRPTVTDYAGFQKAVQSSGYICFRTYSSSGSTSAADFKNRLATDAPGAFSHNGKGAKGYGDGIYVTANLHPQAGTMPDGTALAHARDHSLGYGTPGDRATSCITFAPDINLADGQALFKDFARDPDLTRYLTPNPDPNQPYIYNGLAAYAAARGYDGLIWHVSSPNTVNPCDYITVFNRGKMIILDDPGNNAFGIH
ncbi:MAG: hypothetical protein ACSW8A_11135, partial [Lachnospiraceae bacterium]